MDGVGEPVFHECKDKPWSLYLSNDPDARRSSRELGILHTTPDGIFELWEMIGQYHHYSIGELEGNEVLTSWEDLKLGSAPLNAVVITDRYLLKSKKQAEINIGDLLLLLLPNAHTHVPVEITLLTDIEEAYTHDVEKARSHLVDYIRRDRPELDFNLSLVVPHTGRPPHDRHIFTSYGFFKSGNSFNYFDETGAPVLDTTLDFNPIFPPKSYGVALDKLRRVKELVESTPRELGVHKYVAGSKENRLFRVLE
jgi:hypothetical protein